MADLADKDFAALVGLLARMAMRRPSFTGLG